MRFVTSHTICDVPNNKLECVMIFVDKNGNERTVRRTMPIKGVRANTGGANTGRANTVASVPTRSDRPTP